MKTVNQWIRHNAKPEYPTALKHGSPFLHAYCKIFSQLFIDDGTNLMSLYTKDKSFSDTQSHTTTPLVSSNIKICPPFSLFKTGFSKLRSHCHTGTKISYNTLSQYYFIPFLGKWLSIFIHDCLECQRKKHFNMKNNSAPIQSFSEHAPSFNYRISMDTKGPITPQNKSYIHAIVDAFSHFVVTVPIKSNHAKTAVKTLLHHWIVKFGPPI